MDLSLGFSPCPNDTFIFEALINGRINNEDFQFNLQLADVESLNEQSRNGKLDITKLSYHAYAHVADKYQILDVGSALGFSNGPILISKKKIFPDEVIHTNIAIPGINTTANLLLSLAYPDALNKQSYLFSDIEDVVLSGEQDAGLIIHENRFTYKQKGLKKIIDLGEWWENKTQTPIPLGGIMIRRSLPLETKEKINSLIKLSIEYAFKYPKAGYDYIKQQSQEKDPDIIQKHIELYVNEYSINLGKEGRKAIQQLYQIAVSKNIISPIHHELFIN